MITTPLLLIAALYFGLMYWIAKKLTSWGARIAVMLMFFSPIIYVVWTYQAVKYEHQAACAREGGLKVLIQPEKADRIQLDPNSFSRGSYGRGFLHTYFPKLSVVEVWDGDYDGSVTGRKIGFFAYSPDPATTTLPKKDWKFNKVPLAEFTTGQYVLSETATVEDSVTTTTLKLTRDGKLYATWTQLHHYWSKNGGMPIGWQCFQSQSPEALGKQPSQILIELILK